MTEEIKDIIEAEKEYNAAVLLKRMQDAQRSPISAKGEAI